MTKVKNHHKAYRPLDHHSYIRCMENTIWWYVWRYGYEKRKLSAKNVNVPVDQIFASNRLINRISVEKKSITLTFLPHW
jgi:hypothetical protein